jgi:hypothetical protein
LTRIHSTTIAICSEASTVVMENTAQAVSCLRA